MGILAASIIDNQEIELGFRYSYTTMDYEKKILTYKGKVVFEKINMPKFKRIPKLHDEQEACFMFIDKGAFSVRTQDLLVKFDEEKALLAKCFNYFFELNQQQWEQTTHFELIGVLFYPSIIQEVFELDFTKFEQKEKHNVQQVEVTPLLQNFKEGIKYLLDHPHLANDTLILLKLREFVQLIIRQNNSTSSLDFFTTLFNPVEYNLKTTVENNIYSNLNTNEFALLCNMSTSTFKRKFKQVYKTPFRTYIQEQKIAKSEQLLKYSSLSITEIAFEVGFESISTFNRNFKNSLQLSPSIYREKNRIS